jgi:hypothetical protein
VRSDEAEDVGGRPGVGGSTPDTAFASVHLLAAVAAGIAFTVTLRARSRDTTVMCAATVLALAANEVGVLVFGKDASAFVAALVVGVVGGVVGSLLRRSSLVFVVPGVLLLVRAARASPARCSSWPIRPSAGSLQASTPSSRRCRSPTA